MSSGNSRGRDIFSTHDAARICRVTPMTVIRWIKEGKIPAFKTAGGHRRILRAELERFCRTRGIPFDRADDGQGRILIVDGDAAVRDAIAEVARAVEETLMIEMAADAFAAGRQVAQLRPNLMFLDQRLPGLDTLDACARLAREPDTSAIAVVVMAPAPNADLERCYRARGATACIGRPPPPPVVERCVRETFRLDAAGELAGDRDANVATRATQRILVVDADARFGRDLRRELDGLLPGSQVAFAETAADALITVGAERPTLIVLDLGLWRLEGVDIIRRIRGHLAGEPVTIIAVAEPALAGLRPQAIAAGALDLLVKPFTAEQVLAQVASAAAAGGRRRGR